MSKAVVISSLLVLLSGCASAPKEDFFTWPDNYQFLPLNEQSLVVNREQQPVKRVKSEPEPNEKKIVSDDFYSDFKALEKQAEKPVKPQNKESKKQQREVVEPTPSVPLPVVKQDPVAPVKLDDGLGDFFVQIASYPNLAAAVKAAKDFNNAKAFKEDSYYKVGIFGFENFYQAQKEARYYLGAWIRRTNTIKNKVVQNRKANNSVEVATRAPQRVKAVRREADKPPQFTDYLEEQPEKQTPSAVVGKTPKPKAQETVIAPKSEKKPSKSEISVPDKSANPQPMPQQVAENSKSVSTVEQPKVAAVNVSTRLSEFLVDQLQGFSKVVWSVNKPNGMGVDYRIMLSDVWTQGSDNQVLSLVKQNFPVSFCQLADNTLIIIHTSAECRDWNNL
jgi:outer membrane biosynthesis protein TonB